MKNIAKFSTEFKISFVKGIKDAAIEGLSSIMTAVFVYYSSYLIVKKPELGYKSEDFLFLVFAILFAANEIVYYLSIIDDLKKASVSAKKVLAILEKEPRVDQVKEGQNEFTTQFIGRIELIDVGFKYKTRPKKEENVNNSNDNEAGQTVAIVGKSGCGKTTMLQVLTRFYEIDEGRILSDDIGTSTMNPQKLRSLISVVPQEPVVFTMSIRENIQLSASFNHERLLRFQ